MLIFPVLFSYLIGRRLIRIFIPDSPNKPFYYFLFFGVGVGISSQIVFLSLIFFNQFRPVAIIAGHIVLLLLLYRVPVKSPAPTKNLWHGSLPPLSYFFFMMCLFLILAAPAAFVKPFGDWDAWALWNFRANFICRSAGLWRNIFHFNLHGHYPWLLPFYIVYGWAFAAGEDYVFPLLTSVIFSLCVLGLLFYGLCQRGTVSKAVFSGIFLCSTPFFIRHAVSQYADIVVAYYLLAALVLVTHHAQDGVRRYFLAGFMLGCAAFSKDEGSVLSLLFLTTLFFYLPWVSWRALGAGFLTVMPALMTVKLWMTGDPAGLNKIYLPYLLDLSRWGLVLGFILKHLFFSRWWGAAWLLLILILWLNKKKLKGPLRGIFYATVIFLLIFMALYVVVFNNLPWRLAVSADRLFFQITPLLTYTAFSCL